MRNSLLYNENITEDLLLFYSRSIAILLGTIVNIIEKFCYFDKIENLFYSYYMINGRVDDFAIIGKVYYFMIILLALVITIIQYHIIISGYRITGVVQAYTKRSLKFLSGYCAALFCNECLFLLFPSITSLFNIVGIILGNVIVPIAFIWLNDNSRQYFIARLKRAFTTNYLPI